MTRRRPLTPRRLAPGELPAVEGIEAASTVAELVDAEHAIAAWSARRSDYADVWDATSPLGSALTRRLVELAEADPAVVDEVRALDGGPEVSRRGPFGSRPCAEQRLGLRAHRAATFDGADSPFAALRTHHRKRKQRR